MTLGVSLFLVAVGAILRFAVTADVAGIDIQVVGTILIVVGIVGFLISLLLYLVSRNDTGRPQRPPL
jgi:phosphate/sulfate permease